MICQSSNFPPIPIMIQTNHDSYLSLFLVSIIICWSSDLSSVKHRIVCVLSSCTITTAMARACSYRVVEEVKKDRTDWIWPWQWHVLMRIPSCRRSEEEKNGLNMVMTIACHYSAHCAYTVVTFDLQDFDFDILTSSRVSVREICVFWLLYTTYYISLYFI